MTYAPASLTQLMAYLGTKGVANLGIVGDAAHAGRASYHNGQDRITAAGRTCATDYTICHPRDREPALTNAASAVDLGAVNGSLAGLQTLSRWLGNQCRTLAPDSADIREAIWSPDGVQILHWDAPTGKVYIGGTGTGHGDDSHRSHTHISYFRDSEARDKRPLFRRYFEEAEVLTTITVLPFGGSYVIEANTAPVGIKFDPATGVIGSTLAWPAQPTSSSANYDAVMTTTAMKGSPFLRCIDGHFAGYWLSAGQVTETPNPAPLPDCSAAVAAEYARVKAGTTATATIAFPEPPV